MKRFLILVVLLSQTIFCASSLAAESVSDPITKTLVWPDGTRYVGGVVDGKRSGKGTIFWQDGTRFVGQFENDMRNGPGTMILPDGTVYTGFFENDELVDTEATIAASNAEESVELNAGDSAAALSDTDLPMEADSVSGEQIASAMDNKPIPQVDEHDLVEVASQESASTLIEEEADYPSVVDEEAPAIMDEEPEEEIAQIATEVPEPVSEYATAEDESTDPYNSDVTAISETVKEELIETIDLWAAAWSDQNVPQYLANYSAEFKVPGKQSSRRTWEALRKTRISRPSYINLDLTYQRFEFEDTNIVDVFFRQAYRSNSYSDLTDKVLRMRKEGTDWKILIERSR